MGLWGTFMTQTTASKMRSPTFLWFILELAGVSMLISFSPSISQSIFLNHCVPFFLGELFYKHLDLCNFIKNL
jgi:hypothetical protein